MTILTSHLLLDIVHGGYDDPAGLTLWLDPSVPEAHLTGHSGSMMPLAGPIAPAGAIVFEASGRGGHIAIFDTETIAGLLSDLEPVVQSACDEERRAPGTVREGHPVHSAILDRLEAVDLEEDRYDDWLAENEPDTHSELYG